MVGGDEAWADDPRLRTLEEIFYAWLPDLTHFEAEQYAARFLTQAQLWTQPNVRDTRLGLAFNEALTRLKYAPGEAGPDVRKAWQGLSASAPRMADRTVFHLRVAVEEFKQRTGPGRASARAVAAYGDAGLALLGPLARSTGEATRELAERIQGGFEAMAAQLDKNQQLLRRGEEDGWIVSFAERLTSDLQAMGPEGQAALPGLAPLFAGEQPRSSRSTRLLARVFRRPGGNITLGVVSRPREVARADRLAVIQTGSRTDGGSPELGEVLTAMLERGSTSPALERLADATATAYAALDHESSEIYHLGVAERRARSRVASVLPAAYAQEVQARPAARGAVTGAPLTRAVQGPVPGLEQATDAQWSMLAKLSSDERLGAVISEQGGVQRVDLAYERIHQWEAAVEAASAYAADPQLPPDRREEFAAKAATAGGALTALQAFVPAAAGEAARTELLDGLSRATALVGEVALLQRQTKVLTDVRAELGLAADPAAAERELVALPRVPGPHGGVTRGFVAEGLARVGADPAAADPAVLREAEARMRIARYVQGGTDAGGVAETIARAALTLVRTGGPAAMAGLGPARDLGPGAAVRASGKGRGRWKDPGRPGRERQPPSQGLDPGGPGSGPETA